MMQFYIQKNVIFFTQANMKGSIVSRDACKPTEYPKFSIVFTVDGLLNYFMFNAYQDVCKHVPFRFDAMTSLV